MKSPSRTQVRTVRCPKCDASPGHPCVETPARRERYVHDRNHQERVNAWLDRSLAWFDQNFGKPVGKAIIIESRTHPVDEAAQLLLSDGNEWKENEMLSKEEFVRRQALNLGDDIAKCRTCGNEFSTLTKPDGTTVKVCHPCRRIPPHKK